MQMFPVTAVLVALAAAVLFGLSDVAEQRSTHEVPERRALSPRLLLDLGKRKLWLAAIVVNLFGNVLQIVALHFGALALVQPILVCDLIFAAVFAAIFARRRPDLVMSTGVICCAAGVGGFLAIARPGGGRNTVSFAAFLPLALVFAAVVAGCLAAAYRGPRQIRPLWLALACGITFGVNAFLLKLVPDTLPAGFSDPLRQWPLYAVVIVGPAGFLLSQNAFQAGTLISPVLAIITAADPLVSIAVAHAWLGETISSTPLALAGEVVSLAVMTGGIYLLAHRAPQVVSRTADKSVSPTADGSRLCFDVSEDGVPVHRRWRSSTGGSSRHGRGCRVRPGRRSSSGHRPGGAPHRSRRTRRPGGWRNGLASPCRCRTSCRCHSRVKSALPLSSSAISAGTAGSSG